MGGMPGEKIIIPLKTNSNRMFKNAPACRLPAGRQAGQAGICRVPPAYNAELLTGHLPVREANEG